MENTLYTAKKYQVELTDEIILTGESKGAISAIFSEFEISTNADDEFDNEYDMYRSELVRLRDEIKNQTEFFKECEEFLNEQLDEIGITQKQFVKVLDSLINQSDQNNEMVLLSWL